jgi:hypothetical protein
MILICNYASAGMALLFEKNELAYFKVTDLDSKFCKRLTANAVSTVIVFVHDLFLLFILLMSMQKLPMFMGA